MYYFCENEKCTSDYCLLISFSFDSSIFHLLTTTVLFKCHCLDFFLLTFLLTYCSFRQGCCVMLFLLKDSLNETYFLTLIQKSISILIIEVL